MGAERAWIRSSEPIFPVADVVATVRYYRDVLGFEKDWVWGEPPDFGGVRWGKVGGNVRPSIQAQTRTFTASGIRFSSRGSTGSIACIGATALRSTRPWRPNPGVCVNTQSETSTGITFGSAKGGRTGRPAKSRQAMLWWLSDCRRPKNTCASSRQWDGPMAITSIGPESSYPARFGVVAVDGETAVGTGIVLGDGTTFAYLKDIVVHPEWQGRGIGTRIVDGLLAIIRRSPDGMLVTLFTAQHLAEFYEQFGFAGPEKLYGMSLEIESTTRS